MNCYRHDPALYAVGDVIYLQTPRGWNTWQASKGEVTRKTPSGQIIAKFGERELRINARGRIADSRQFVISEEEALKLFAEEAEDRLWLRVRDAADAVVHVTRQRDINALRAAIAKLTSAMDRLAKDPTQ